ncbi:MAG: LacI family DNA-binding transcriptional regulator [Kiritimatiellia bacterium]|jgi:LacI family transcriptional regulator
MKSDGRPPARADSPRRAFQGRVTTTDISKVVGVSQPVVSKVLNGGASNICVSAAVREKIVRVARELGYRSNSAARAMRTGRFNCAALLLGAQRATSLLPVALFYGLLDGLARHAMHMTVAKLPDAKLVQDGVVPNLLADLYADGLLINYNAKIPRKLIDFVDEYRLPSVWINSKQAFDCVYPDDFDAMRRLTLHFIETGSADVAYVGKGTWHYSSKLRRDGYLDAVQGKGLRPRMLDLKVDPEPERLACLREFLRGPKLPSAVVCYRQEEVDLVCLVCEELGLPVGQALRLGVVHEQEVLYNRRPIPTMVLPEHELGMEAVAMLLRKIRRPEIRQDPVKVPCRLAGVEA